MRAVHIEIAHSLDTSFLGAFTRFTSPNGQRSYNETATNFKGADAVLKENSQN